MLALVLEASLHTASGVLERWVNPADEREYRVVLKRAEFEEVVEDLILTRKAPHQDGKSMIFNPSRQFAPRVYDLCQAQSMVSFPNPRFSPIEIQLVDLECNEPAINPQSGCYQESAQTNSARIQVFGKDRRDWVDCDWNYPLCFWNDETEGSRLQRNIMTFVTWAAGIFQNQSLIPKMPKIFAYSFDTATDRSQYSADSRTLSFGGGAFLDADDASIVLHEWIHAVVDDLNPRLWGYESSVLHEALADFFSASLLNDSCIGAYDAQERQIDCVRQISNTKTFDKDFQGRNRHLDSLPLSGAFWSLRDRLGASLVHEILMEAIIRSPKSIKLNKFWAMLTKVADRISHERPEFDKVVETIRSEAYSRKIWKQ